MKIQPLEQTALRHLAWEQLKDRIKDGIPFVYRIPSPTTDGPSIDILVSELGAELSMWIPCTTPMTPPPSPLVEIDISLITTPTGQKIEIKTRLASLFQEIYSFFVSISDKIQLNQADPFAAVHETLDGWRELLKTRAILSEEAQLGLRGELHILRMLTTIIGDQALAAWTGPQKQPHDFRIGAVELEAKATTGVTHTHIINGLRQLEPSPGHRLYVYSMRFAPAGAKAGTTLSEDIEATRAELGSAARIRFDAIIKEHFGYRNEHSVHYRLNLQVAGTTQLILVDDSCPRLTVPLIQSIPHRGRISDVSYRANFEGLGFSVGISEFYDVISSAHLQTI